MIELFKKEGRSIFTFKKGDIIIQLESIESKKQVHNENLGVITEISVGFDNSFRRPLEFIGIYNNLIYLRDIKEDLYFKTKSIHKAYLEYYSENWDLFVIPDGLTLDDCL